MSQPSLPLSKRAKLEHAPNPVQHVTNILATSSTPNNPPTVQPNPVPPQLIIIYTPTASLPSLSPYMNKEIEIRVPTKFISTKNKEILRRHVWGTDVYTDDSDAVAMAVHSGLLYIRSHTPVLHTGIIMRCRVCPGEKEYAGSNRNGIESRSWTSEYHGVSLKLLRCAVSDDTADFAPRTQPGGPPVVALQPPPSSHAHARGHGAKHKAKVRYIEDVAVVFNREHEPSLRYCLALVSDRGMGRREWTSTRLRVEVMYFEAGSHTYELSAQSNPLPSPASAIDPSEPVGLYATYRWAQLKSGVPSIRAGDRRSIPLPQDQLDVLYSDLDWHDIVWADKSLEIKGRKFDVSKVNFWPTQAPIYVADTPYPHDAGSK